MKPVLVDTGVIVALLDRSERFHAPCVAVMEGLERPLVTCTRSPFLIFIFAMGYSTSGASEIIFMNFFSRSSRPTGPKIRVPRGSPSALRMTAAFSSNLI